MFINRGGKALLMLRLRMRSRAIRRRTSGEGLATVMSGWITRERVATGAPDASLRELIV
jgi:hypothetical protein